MAIKTYTGAVGDNNWYTAGNWTPAGFPTALDDAIIPATKYVSLYDGNIAYKSITTSGTVDFIQAYTTTAASTITVNSGGVVEFRDGSGNSFSSITINGSGICRFYAGFNETEITINSGTLLFADGSQSYGPLIGKANSLIVVNTGSNISGESTTLESGAVCNFNEYSVFSGGSLNIQAGAECVFDSSSMENVNPTVYGLLKFQNGQGFFNSSGSGVLTIASGGSCIFDTGSKCLVAITQNAGASLVFQNGASAEGAITNAAGTTCFFTGGSILRSRILGNGNIRYDKSSMLRQLIGFGGRSATLTNTQYPTNFGGGTL